MKRAFLAILFWAAAGPAGANPLAPAMPGVGFDQRIGGQLPRTARFRDADGNAVRLGDYFGRGPVILLFGYSRCPQLCSIIADNAVQALRQLKVNAGTAYQVVYVSIDPTDGPREMAAMKRRDLDAYGRPGTGAAWHYLCGDEADIRRATEAAGFLYVYDRRTQLYGHASGFVIATPDGRLSRYFLGLEFPAQDVSDALARAGQGKTGPSMFELVLVCARGMGFTGRYARLAWEVLECAVAATVLALAAGVGWMLYQERKRGLP